MKGSWGIITGASSGIGKDFARQLAKRGVNTIIVARRLERLNEFKKELETKYQVQAECIQADLTQEDAPKMIFDEATKNNRKVQFLINNAGVGNYGSFLDYDLESHLKTIQLNITSLTKMTYYFARHMRDHDLESHIVNVASIAAYQAIPEFGVYCGTKKYVKDLSETLYHEYKSTNLHVCCVSPGGTYTEFMDHSGQVLKKSAQASMMSSQEVARIGIEASLKKKSAVVTGLLNNIVVFLPRLLPTNLLIKIGDLAMKMSVSKKKPDSSAQLS